MIWDVKGKLSNGACIGLILNNHEVTLGCALTGGGRCLLMSSPKPCERKVGSGIPEFIANDCSL